MTVRVRVRVRVVACARTVFRLICYDCAVSFLSVSGLGKYQFLKHFYGNCLICVLFLERGGLPWPVP